MLYADFQYYDPDEQEDADYTYLDDDYDAWNPNNDNGWVNYGYVDYHGSDYSSDDWSEFDCF